MRQGDVRRWRVRGLTEYFKIFQNISKYFKQLHSEEDGRSSVSGSDSLSLSEAPFSLAIFFPFSLRCNLSGGVSAISRDMEASFFLSFLLQLSYSFLWPGQALNLPDHWLLGMFLSYFRVTFGDVLFPFLGESSVPRNRAGGVVLQPELEIVTRVLLRFPFQRRKSLCCLLKTPLVNYSRSLSKQLYNWSLLLGCKPKISNLE